MGDMADMYRAMNERKRQFRQEQGINCWLCEELYPKRNPTVLLPGRTCKVCGYKDQRPWVNM